MTMMMVTRNDEDQTVTTYVLGGEVHVSIDQDDDTSAEIKLSVRQVAALMMQLGMAAAIAQGAEVASAGELADTD